jgi:hypothetical protein
MSPFESARNPPISDAVGAPLRAFPVRDAFHDDRPRLQDSLLRGGDEKHAESRRRGDIDFIVDDMFRDGGMGLMLLATAVHVLLPLKVERPEGRRPGTLSGSPFNQGKTIRSVAEPFGSITLFVRDFNNRVKEISKNAI